MRRVLMLGAVALALAGCAGSLPEPPKTLTVEKPVQVLAPVVAKCKVTISPEPAYPDSDGAISGAQSLTDLAKMYRAGRALRSARIAYLTALLQQCVE